ncbi:MAG TPA: DHA2 family efflux MFS transporter permease subunit [Balneolaceae bacterium]|nr:DHA2 family efflux MFS transporter permease subunit [Balneolaceae bacterium]
MTPRDHHKPTVEYGFRRVIITVTVIIAALLELIDTTIVNVTIPTIRGSMGATLSTIGWVVAGYTLANAIVVPITAWLSSIFGRRTYYVGSIILFTFSSFMCGHSGTIHELIFWRLVQGTGGGALMALANAILVEIYPDELIGFANAMFGLGVVLGPTIGPLLGGYLVQNYSWPWIFYVNIPVGILAALLSLIFLKEPPEKRKTGKFDWQGLLFLIIGVGSLQVVLEKGADKNWFQTNYIIYMTITAIVGLIVFVWWEIKKAKNPVVDLTILKTREVALGTIFLFIVGTGLYARLFLLPQFEQYLLGFSAYQSGVSLIPGGLAAMMLMPFLGLALRKGAPPRLISGFGFTVFFISCYLISRQNLQSGGVLFGDFFLPIALRGVSLACLFVPLQTITLSKLEGPDIAQGTGLANMARQLGGSFGLAMVATFVNYRSAFYRSDLVDDISMYNRATRTRVNHLIHLFTSQGYGPIRAAHQAYSVLEGTVVQNVLQLTYSDAFFYIGLLFLCCVPLLFFIRKVKNAGPPGAH